MFKKLFILIFLCVTFLTTLSNRGYAANDTPVASRIGPDGTLSIIAQDVDDFWNSSSKFSIEVHKIMSDKLYYAVRICLTGKESKNNSFTSLKLILDGKDYILEPLQNARKELLPDGIQEWYAVDDKIITVLANVKKVKIELLCTNGKVYKNNTGSYFVNSLHRLNTISKENYAQQSSIKSESGSHLLFVPGTKPEELGPAFIHTMNYRDYKGKDEFSYSDYYIVTKTDDYKMMSFESTERFWQDGFFQAGRNDYPYIWITMQPENGGTWLNVYTMGKAYDSDAALYYIGPWQKVSTSEFAEADKWADAIMSVYKMYYGKYNYGLDWSQSSNEKDVWKAMRAEWRNGPFVVRTVDKKLFPELAQVNPGDVITEIDGIPTTNIKFKESILFTAYSGKLITFTIRDISGNQRRIAVNPKFEPCNLPKPNYQQIISNETRQFKKFDFNHDCPFSVPKSYNPLGNGYQ